MQQQPQRPPPVDSTPETLARGEVRLWSWNIGVSGSGAVAARERTRRVWQRVLPVLDQYNPQPTRPMAIVRSSNGKPILPGLPLAFSLAHDNDRALLALCDSTCLGVDLLAPRCNHREALARRVLSAAELQTWRDLDAQQRGIVLSTRFCAIEAVVKALDWRLWSALGTLHFVKSGREVRVPMRRARLHLHSGSDAGHVYAIASDQPILSLRWMPPPAAHA